MPINQEQAAQIQNSVYEKLLGEAYNKVAALQTQLIFANAHIEELTKENKELKDAAAEGGQGQSSNNGG